MALIEEEQTICGELKRLLDCEEQFYKQKAREKWVKLEDSNTKFFHNLVKAGRAHNKVTRLTPEDGTRITEQSRLAQAMIDYYQKLLGVVSPSRSHAEASILQ